MMKLIPLLLCLLLCGCAREVPEAEPTTLPPVTVSQTVPTEAPAVLSDAGNGLEEKYGGTLKAYPLNLRKVQGMQAFYDGLLLFSGYGSTTLTLLGEDSLTAAASTTLDFELDSSDPSLRIWEDALSYFDPVNRETVVLDHSLKEVSHIAAPEGLTGTPILSADRNTLYYCTSTAIRAWNLETGIRRTVKELSYEEQELTGLHLDDTVLQCRILDGGTERTLLLSTDTGQLVHERAGDIALETLDGKYGASFLTGMRTTLLFGDTQGQTWELFPEDSTGQCVFLLENWAAATISTVSTEHIRLDYYDLSTGTLRAALTLEAEHCPSGMIGGEGDCLYLLSYDPEYDCDVIFRWDVPQAGGSQVYTDTYRTDPEYGGLSQCQAYAAEIGAKYGIDVLVWEDALAVQPWDYEFEGEYLVPVLQKELALLDQRLSLFPEGMLATTASHFSSLNICLVRQITGTAESGSVATATGIQFLDGTDAYVVITVGNYSQQALYHELFHVMETHILNESVAFDQWEDLNPEDFSYDYSYSGHAQQTYSAYLEGENRAFADGYSMSFPKEDRARIMENAVAFGNAELFQSRIMQAKLTKLCEGIREAYGLRKSSETFLWEQYLQTSLAYEK